MTQKEEYSVSKKKPILTDIFDRYEKDTVTDLQVLRVLEPVLRMIVEGRFERKNKLKSALVIGVFSIIMFVLLILTVHIF